MKTKLLFTALLFAVQLSAIAQEKLAAKNGHIWFYSRTPLETIEAHNKQVVAVIDTKTGDMVFNLLIKSFSFERALMEEHFNENYMESQKFPRSSFKGKIVNLNAVKFNAPGTYTAVIEGELTIHGVTKKVKETGSFQVGPDNVKALAKFKLAPSDFGIKIPAVVSDKISKQFEVCVDMVFKKAK